MKADRGVDARGASDDRFASWGREMLAGGVLCASAAVLTLIRAPSVYAAAWLGSDADKFALMYFHCMRSCLLFGMVLTPSLLCIVRGKVEPRVLVLQLGLLAGMGITLAVPIVGNAELRMLAPALFRPLAWCWNWRGVFFLDLFVRVLTLAGMAGGALALFRVCTRTTYFSKKSSRTFLMPELETATSDKRPVCSSNKGRSA